MNGRFAPLVPCVGCGSALVEDEQLCRECRRVRRTETSAQPQRGRSITSGTPADTARQSSARKTTPVQIGNRGLVGGGCG